MLSPPARPMPTTTFIPSPLFWFFGYRDVGYAHDACGCAVTGPSAAQKLGSRMPDLVRFTLAAAYTTRAVACVGSTAYWRCMNAGTQNMRSSAILFSLRRSSSRLRLPTPHPTAHRAFAPTPTPLSHPAHTLAFLLCPHTFVPFLFSCLPKITYTQPFPPLPIFQDWFFTPIPTYPPQITGLVQLLGRGSNGRAAGRAVAFRLPTRCRHYFRPQAAA